MEQALYLNQGNISPMFYQFQGFLAVNDGEPQQPFNLDQFVDQFYNQQDDHQGEEI